MEIQFSQFQLLQIQFFSVILIYCLKKFILEADPSTLDLLYSENGIVPDIEEVINISKKHKYIRFFSFI